MTLPTSASIALIMDFTGPVSHSFISQRLRLHYVDWGNPDAPPLILQHGGRDHCRSWDWVADALRNDWHVMAPDLRGHGDSAWSPDGGYDMNAYVYDFAQFVHQLGCGEVTIIAHSLGGNITSQFAGLYPAKVRKFVNIEGLGMSPERQIEQESQGRAATLRTWIAERRQASARQPKRYPTLEAAYARMKAVNGFLTDAQARHLTIHGASRNEDGTWSWKYDSYLNVWPPNQPRVEWLHDLWSAITCPVLMFYGENSGFTTNPELDGRKAYFRNATLKVYENAGHWLHHDQFDRFVTDVRAFI